MCSLRDIIGCNETAEKGKPRDGWTVKREIEVERSLHVSQESKTPYSDATQVTHFENRFFIELMFSADLKIIMSNF